MKKLAAALVILFSGAVHAGQPEQAPPVVVYLPTLPEQAPDTLPPAAFVPAFDAPAQVLFAVGDCPNGQCSTSRFQQQGFAVYQQPMQTTAPAYVRLPVQAPPAMRTTTSSTRTTVSYRQAYAEPAFTVRAERPRFFGRLFGADRPRLFARLFGGGGCGK